MGEKPAVTAALCAQLGITDRSLGVFLLLIAATLLSFFSVVVGREGLCRTIAGDAGGAEALPPLFPMKIGASALALGALAFFLCLALHTLQAAEAGEDRVAKKSARVNLWASILVFVAALLRLDDLNFVERCRRALVAEDTLPEL